MNIKYFMIVLVSLKISCAINDSYGNLIDINNFETFEMVPHLNRNHDSVKEYSKKLSSYFCTKEDLYRPKFGTNDPIFDGHDIYYKDNSKNLISYFKKTSHNTTYKESLFCLTIGLIIGIPIFLA